MLVGLVVLLHHAQQVRQAASLTEAKHAIERAWRREVRRRRDAEVQRRRGARRERGATFLLHEFGHVCEGGCLAVVRYGAVVALTRVPPLKVRRWKQRL